MVKSFTFACLFLICMPDGLIASAESLPTDDFVITVQTENPGTSTDTQFTIPTHSTGPFFPGYTLVALNPTACRALDFAGLSTTTILDAGIFSNSDCPATPGSFYLGSGVEATIQYDVTAVGGINVSGTVAAGEFSSYMPHLDLEQVLEPDCSGLPARDDSGTTLQPGIYNGIHITSQDVILEPGLYCLDADLRVQGGTLTGDVVTLFVRGSASVIVNGGEAFLRAPQNDPWADGSGMYWNGMLIYQQYGNTASIHIKENVDSYYEGTIFAPDASCSFEGSSIGVVQDIQVACDMISIVGKAEFVIEYNPANH